VSTSNIHSLVVGIEADTCIRVVRPVPGEAYSGVPGYERIEIGDAVIWPGYLSHEEADVVRACDRLIEALQEVRAHSLQRLAKAAS
jgi:hypothetical protein